MAQWCARRGKICSRSSAAKSCRRPCSSRRWSISMRQLTIKSGQGNYDVKFLEDLLGLTGLLETAPKAVLVLDKNVAQRYSAQLSRLTATLPTLTVPATEEEKTLEGVTRVLTFLQQHDCNKQSVIIAVGGGIIQDIVAFAAHVYYRGLKWFFV